jgi:type IV pilus assembly protein PilN
MKRPNPPATDQPEINLASQPLRQERALNAALAAISVGLACSLVVLLSLVLHARVQAADLRNTIAGENAQLRALQREQAEYSSVVGKPANANVFATNVFLNELIARRAVSWTKVFSDLQTVLPEDMRLLGIRLPQLASEDASGANRVQLDMIVASEKPEVLITFLKRLQQSPLFGPTSVMTQTPPSQNDPYFKFRVTVAYAQTL